MTEEKTETSSANQVYGELQEGLHIAGYTFERACHRIENLLTGNLWKDCGHGFLDVNAFISSLPLDQFKGNIEQRKRIGKLIKDLQPAASNVAIAKAVGVAEKTIRNDSEPDAKKPNEIKGGDDEIRNNSEPVVTDKKTTRDLLSQSDQNDWRTPRKYLDAAHAVMDGIDLDPASGPEANETVRAAIFYTEQDDGLKKPWKGRVWLNPPYGGEARLFVERLLREFQVGNVTAAMTLVNSHPTETKWFQGLFDHTICFVRGRIDFGGPSRAVSSTSTHGSAIVYMGTDVDKFAKVFSEFGSIVRKIRI